MGEKRLPTGKPTFYLVEMSNDENTYSTTEWGSVLNMLRHGKIEWRKDAEDSVYSKRYFRRIDPAVGPQHHHTFSDNPDAPAASMACLDCGMTEDFDREITVWDE
jgi:hypothetical protein